MRRRIAVFTSSRADLGPLGPVVSALDAHPAVALLVIATGTHVDPRYGGRAGDIRLTGDSELELLDVQLGGTSASDLGGTYARIAAGVSRILSEHEVDILVVLGDRWELLAAVGAALIHGVPIAHLHGGETTEGAMDERIRHSITKLADLHLCATEDSARRIRRLGEEARRIVVTGAPGLDRVDGVSALSEEHLQAVLAPTRLVRPFGVVVFHPPTVEREDVALRAREVYAAAAECLGSALLLFPGADPGSDAVINEIHAAVARHPNLTARPNLGEQYLPVLKSADVLLGNSSSGIIEAASLRLPVVDVGDRQRGRLRPRNVIHVDDRGPDILGGLRRALDADFRLSLADVSNPYGDGRASTRIVDALLAADARELARKPLIEHADGEPALERMTVAAHASLRDALAAIDRGGNQIVFVTNDAGCLVGSLSDGDVRRALLAGATLSDGVERYMTRVPIVASPADGVRKVLELMERHGITQIPIVDDGGRLVGVHLMKAIVGDALGASFLAARAATAGSS